MARAVVVGGRMAGVAFAAELADNDVVVTPVDREDYRQFQPLLDQVASSQLPAEEDIARPHRVISRCATVSMVTSEMTGDLAERIVTNAHAVIGPADHAAGRGWRSIPAAADRSAAAPSGRLRHR